MFAMTATTLSPSTWKVRRDVVGGKRGQGKVLHRRIRRPDPRKIGIDATDAKITSSAGLALFGAFARELGVDDELESKFGHLKTGPLVVYPMGAQLRALVDANLAGEHRVMGIEALAADPLFEHLVGGSVASIDTFYRDLRRFGPESNHDLDDLVARHGLEGHGLERFDTLHLDIDTHVNPVFGTREGAVPGYNPRYRGRPCLHPLTARIAETDTCIGARLRPGSATFGAQDADYVRTLVRRVVARLSKKQVLFVRMDAAADCTPILEVFEQQNVHYVVKARVTEDLSYSTLVHAQWKTIEHDAEGEPLVQAAEIDFKRMAWVEAGISPRVIAVRTREPGSGRQLTLWEGEDWTVKLYLSSSPELPEEIAARYEGRAGIEPLIAEWKNGWGMDHVPCFEFDANQAALLIKMLAHNLLRRFVRSLAPELSRWRVSWLRRALVRVPGQLVHSARAWLVRVMPSSKLLEVVRRRE